MALTEEEKKERKKVATAKWRAANKDKTKAYNKGYYGANKKKAGDWATAWRATNKDKLKVINKRHYDMVSSSLAESYIKSLLCNKSSLTRSDIPQELIELKRLEIKLKRNLKEQNNG